jgi:hypothetical protein
MYNFCKAVVVEFGTVYLREPTIEDIARLLPINEARGFLGMIGSIDCMHWSGRTACLHGTGSIVGMQGMYRHS